MKSLKNFFKRMFLALYRESCRAFFAMGGRRALEKKYGKRYGKAYRDKSRERTGRLGDGPKGVVWVHAQSAGEVQSAAPFIHQMQSNAAPPRVLSVSDPTGVGIAEKLTAPWVERIFYSPWDAPQYVKNALDCLRPKAFIAIDLWRNSQTLFELQARKIPSFLINGRMSERQRERRRKIAPFWREFYSCLSRILVRTERDKENFMAFGVSEERIFVTGDGKADAVLLRKEGTDRECWRHLRPADAPLFIAGSIHPSEAETVLTAFVRVRRRHPAARMIAAPRFLEAVSTLMAALPPFNLKGRLLSEIKAQAAPWDVAVVDSMGILFELYGAADAAFVGYSLIPKGGHNILEPMVFGLQTTHGPSTHTFMDAPLIDRMGAAVQIQDADALTEAWMRAAHPEEKTRAADATQKYFDSLGNASLRSWEIVREYLERKTR